MDQGFRIGQVAEQIGLNPKTIRYYEEIGLIPPPKRGGGGWASPGRRLFTPADVERLVFIKRARLLDLSLSQIRDLLSAVEEGCCGTARPQLKALLEAKLEELNARITELQLLYKSLERLFQEIIMGAGVCAPTASASQCAFGLGPLEIQCNSPADPSDRK